MWLLREQAMLTQQIIILSVRVRMCEYEIIIMLIIERLHTTAFTSLVPRLCMIALP